MFELLVFRPAFGEPTSSPFCVKAMCLLALAEAEWRPVVVDDPRRMPHGKLPVLRDGDRLIPDSEAIRAHLESFGPDLDAGLSRRERAISRAVIRLADEDLYFHILQDRWADDRVWPQVRAAYFGMIPGLVRRPVTAMIRRQVLRDLHGQGTGRLSAEERAFWSRCLVEGKIADGDLETALGILRRHGAIAATVTRAKDFGARAIAALDPLPDSEWKQALVDVVGFCIARVH